jgi:hypothetical protein
VSGLVPAESAGQIVFDFLLSVAAILVAELHFVGMNRPPFFTKGI